MSPIHGRAFTVNKNSLGSQSMLIEDGPASFEDRGEHALKGIADAVRVYAVRLAPE